MDPYKYYTKEQYEKYGSMLETAQEIDARIKTHKFENNIIIFVLSFIRFTNSLQPLCWIVLNKLQVWKTQGGGLNGSKMMIKTKMVYRAYYSSLKYGKIIDTKHN